jgi:hypothetical protein
MKCDDNSVYFWSQDGIKGSARPFEDSLVGGIAVPGLGLVDLVIFDDDGWRGDAMLRPASTDCSPAAILARIERRNA